MRRSPPHDRQRAARPPLRPRSSPRRPLLGDRPRGRDLITAPEAGDPRPGSDPRRDDVPHVDPHSGGGAVLLDVARRIRLLDDAIRAARQELDAAAEAYVEVSRISETFPPGVIARLVRCSSRVAGLQASHAALVEEASLVS